MRRYQTEDISGYDLVSACGGVGSVLLHHAIDAVDALEEEGKKGDGVLFREQGVGLLELVDVVGAVVGREGDSGESDLCAAGLEAREEGIEIGSCVLDAQTAEAVVAAELDDDEGGVEGDDVVDAIEAVFRGVSADALVDDVVAKAASVEVFLEVVGVALAGIGSVAGGEAIAEADQEGATVSRCGGRGRADLGGARWCH